jgi:uncharacterized protein YjbI with pentapeptide repeats
MNKDIINAAAKGTKTEEDLETTSGSNAIKLLLEAGVMSLKEMAAYLPKSTTQGVTSLEGEELLASKRRRFETASLNGELETAKAMAYAISLMYPEEYERSNQTIEEYVSKNGLAILDLASKGVFSKISEGIKAENRYFVDLRRPNYNLKDISLSGSFFCNSSLENLKVENVGLLDVDMVDVCLVGAIFEQSPLVRADLIRVNLTGSNFTKNAFSHSNLTEVGFSNSRFKRVNFRESILKGVVADSCKFEKSTFIQTSIQESSFIYSMLQSCDFGDSNISSCELDRINCLDSYFQESRISNCSLRFIIAKNTNWSYARIEQSDLSGASFIEGSKVVKTVFVNCNLTASTWKKVTYGKGVNRNESLYSDEPGWVTEGSEDYEVEGVRFINCEIPNSDFGDESILGMVTNGTNFKNSNFQKSHLDDAEIKNTSFENSNMKTARIEQSSFSDVNLRNVDLSNAEISDTLFSNVDFTGANLHGAKFTNVNFWGVIMPDGTRYTLGCLEKFTGVEEEG